MSDHPPRPKRIAVIGGGISGLAAAHRLNELDGSLEISLFEADDRVGGVLRTEQREGFLVERSADMFTTKDPWALDLCRRIGFDDQLIETNSEHRKAFIVHRGKLVDVPAGFSLMSPSRVWPILATPLLSWRGKLRLGCEYFTKCKRDESDESLASFSRRRMGREVYERIIQPVVGGIYTADPEKLSMAATMPQFVRMEREHGSMIRGVKKADGGRDQRQAASGARYGLFVAPRLGMSSFVEAIAERLPANCIRLNASVEELKRSGEQWQVSLDGRQLEFDGVVIATPAGRSAKLLSITSTEISSDLSSIPHAGAAVVVVGYRKSQIQQPLNGFGFVVPLVENRKILACSFSSVKFSGRAPTDSVLLRVFVGGACQNELAELPDHELAPLVQQELVQLLGATGEPSFREIIRWKETMPQYHIGHLELVKKIEQQVEQLPNLELAGNAYRGVGIPFCIHGGEQAAERLFYYHQEA